MNYLIKGGETSERFELLVGLTKFTDNSLGALRDYLVVGLDDDMAAELNGMTKSNFARTLKRLNEVAEKVELIKEIDWVRFSRSCNRQDFIDELMELARKNNNDCFCMELGSLLGKMKNEH